jgi:VWFA-related protein
MQAFFSRRITVFLVLLVAFAFGMTTLSLAQSRPQRPKKSGEQKKNERPRVKTPEELKKEEEEKRLAEEIKNAEVDEEVLEIKTNLVNVNAVVYDKKSKRIVTGLTKENFAVFENGVKQEITNFAMPEAPITVSLVVEYSKWSELFGQASGGRFEQGHLEVIRPVASFVSSFIKPPDDYASVIAFDMRPTPITDFTNDPQRLRQTVNLLLRNRPAFRENNLFDAIKFVLVGGKADSVVLEDSKERKSEYGGMVDVKAQRRAIILIASGIDTFSRINYDEARKIIQSSGIPIYIISTGNLFYKRYEHLLGPTDSLTGVPGRLTFLQARNAMDTFAKESGGQHFQMTFPGEIPSILNSINASLRNQYSIAYDAGDSRKPGQKYKLEVMVDVNGDGKYDNKKFKVQHRPYYKTEEEDKDSN